MNTINKLPIRTNIINVNTALWTCVLGEFIMIQILATPRIGKTVTSEKPTSLADMVVCSGA